MIWDQKVFAKEIAKPRKINCMPEPSSVLLSQKLHIQLNNMTDNFNYCIINYNFNNNNTCTMQ